MHIGVDARELTGHRTGVGRYLQRLLDRWGVSGAAREHRFTLFVPDRGGLAGDLPGDLPGELLVIEGRGGTAWEQGPLARAVRRLRPDVFFAPAYTAPLFVRVPLALAMHDVSFAAHPEWFRWREAARRRLLARVAASRARVVLTLSQFSRDEIVRHLGTPADRVHVVSPGIDPIAVTSLPREPLVLYVGSIFTRRHVPVLIDAFARLAKERPALRLVIVGEDRAWPPASITAAIEGSGARDRIQHFGWLPDEDLASLYARASAFVFLSSYEGFGLTPLEALAAGVPPVVLDTPVAREAYGDAVVRVPAPDAALVSRALASVLDDEALRQRIFSAANAVLARYRWDVAADRTLQLIEAAAR